MTVLACIYHQVIFWYYMFLQTDLHREHGPSGNFHSTNYGKAN